jgi:hypothetical protein
MTEVWLHWPAIALSNRELTETWCNRLWLPSLRPGTASSGRSRVQPVCSRAGGGPTDRSTACVRIVPRNTASHVPMYGCVGMDDGPPMLVSHLVDAEGRIHEDWLQWLVRHSGPALASVLHIGGDIRWPTSNVDAARVQRLLPLLCSIAHRPTAARGRRTVLAIPWARRATGCGSRTPRPTVRPLTCRPTRPPSVAYWITWRAGVACLDRGVNGRLPPAPVVGFGGGSSGIPVRTGCRLGVPGVVEMAHPE